MQRGNTRRKKEKDSSFSHISYQFHISVFHITSNAKKQIFEFADWERLKIINWKR